MSLVFILAMDRDSEKALQGINGDPDLISSTNIRICYIL